MFLAKVHLNVGYSRVYKDKDTVAVYAAAAPTTQRSDLSHSESVAASGGSSICSLGLTA